MSERNSVVLWCAAQILSAAVVWVTFVHWAAWWSAESYSDAVAHYGQVPQSVSPGCPAVVVSLGDYSCIPWGTVASNLWGFVLLTLLMLAGAIFVALSQHRGKGFFGAATVRLVGHRINGAMRHLGVGEVGPKGISSIIGGLLFIAVLLVIVVVGTIETYIRG